jgi:hypothetical protein
MPTYVNASLMMGWSSQVLPAARVNATGIPDDAASTGVVVAVVVVVVVEVVVEDAAVVLVVVGEDPESSSLQAAATSARARMMPAARRIGPASRGSRASADHSKYCSRSPRFTVALRV